MEQIHTNWSLSQIEVFEKVLSNLVGSLTMLLMSLPIDEMNVPRINFSWLWEKAALFINQGIVGWMGEHNSESQT